MKKNNPFQPFIYAMVLVGGIALGVMISMVSADKKKPLLSGPYNKINDILSYIHFKYVDSVDTEALTDDAINGLLSGLDPHSVYIPATDMEEVNQSLEGNFEGIGIEFYIVLDTVTVVSPISGGPAELLGVKAGDKIIYINDSLVAGTKISNEQVMKKLRGPKGTKVKVKVKRNGVSGLKTFEITRDKIPLYSLDAAIRLADSTGYIKINRFSATTHAEFSTGLQKLLEQGISRLVIDLRQNPGGYLQAATAIADELISGKKILVYTEGNAYNRQDYIGQKPGLYERGELIVLIDQGSASASEILAGAIQDWDRGKIIGRTSFGKGLVQEQFQLRDGSALRLTVARYYTPSGRCIQRPYENGKEAYYQEMADRFRNPEEGKSDSLRKDSLVYRTSEGRKVFGGGGINPDLEVPVDTTIDLEYMFHARSLMPEFVYRKMGSSEFMGKGFANVSEFSKNYSISQALMDEFFVFAKTQGLEQDSSKRLKSETQLRNLLKAFIAKSKWQNEGFYYVLTEGDEFIRASKKK